MPLARWINRWRKPATTDDAAARRVAMTVACRDSDPIPKVADAGRTIDRGGTRVQVMHEGSLVVAGGYHGEWMERIIRELRGHHEPQEELVFHHLLAACRPGTLMIEVGAFWAYYTNWWLGAVPGSRAACVEPDANNRAIGERNLALNGRSATWIEASAGREPSPPGPFTRESDGKAVRVPCHSLASLLDALGRPAVELLHLDCQGAEVAFLGSLGPAASAGLLRFVMVSTHHASILGSTATHGDCLRLLQEAGAVILCEHTVDESFSGDGLVVASFRPEDAALRLPEMSRNQPRNSLFGAGSAGDRPVILAGTDNGPMLVDGRDTVIGAALRERGSFEEGMLREVVRFLRSRHGFRPSTLVDVGANIGTHLLRGLNDGLFERGVGIEMDSDNFRLLTANVALNGHAARTRLWNVAVSEAPGTATMEVASDNRGDHRVRADESASAPADGAFGESGRATRAVPRTTLDAIEADGGLAFDTGTLVWIDVQGHEGHVLAGATGILGRGRRPAFVVEFWPYGLERSGGRARLMRFLAGCRSVHDLGVPGWETRPPVSAAELEERYDRMLGGRDDAGRQYHTDLLCIA